MAFVGFLSMGVLPARAGVILPSLLHRPHRISSSRASGGDPELGVELKARVMFFPRERG